MSALRIGSSLLSDGPSVSEQVAAMERRIAAYEAGRKVVLALAREPASNVERLARMAGEVLARGYRWLDGKWVEFAVTDGGWAWMDDGDGGVSRVTFEPAEWNFHFVPTGRAA